MSEERAVGPADMPQLFLAADATSLSGQKQYVRCTTARLVLIVLAAAAGIVSWRVGASKIDLLSIVGLVLFIGALSIESVLWRNRPDRNWYDGRAVAESVKTLAWKFAVCAQPFPVDMNNESAVREFLGRLGKLRDQFSGLDLVAVNASMVSEWMQDQRRASWAQRKEFYLRNRIDHQKDWYHRKAKYNRRRSVQWRFVLVGLEVAGAIGSLIEALTQAGVLLGPAIAAVVGAVVAWIETKQHDFLARAYGAAVTDLSQVEAKLQIADSERTWSIEVNDAEDAISREHTLWLASRSQL